MNEQEPETVPTSSQIGSAVGLRETHVRICVPEAICRSCWRPWPCENIQEHAGTATPAGRASRSGWPTTQFSVWLGHSRELTT